MSQIRYDDRPRPKRYATLKDAIDYDIRPALGEYADDYDLEAIARETFDYRIDRDEAGRELANSAGFEQVVTTEEFWQIVQKHDKTARSASFPTHAAEAVQDRPDQPTAKDTGPSRQLPVQGRDEQTR